MGMKHAVGFRHEAVRVALIDGLPRKPVLLI